MKHHQPTPEALRGLRRTSGIQLGDMAAFLKIDESVLSKIENGRRALPQDLAARYRAAAVEITRQRAKSAREMARSL